MRIYNNIMAISEEKKGGELCLTKIVEAILENLSTREVFLFRVSCANCGAQYANKPIQFSKACETPLTQRKRIIHDALYEQELRAVRLSAIRSASEHMYYCPICKRVVYNRCFLICDDLDMCKSCAAQLEDPAKTACRSPRLPSLPPRLP